jgi:Tol biopolymer transport system component
VIFNQQGEEKTLLKYGVRVRQGEINPNYPILAWDGKGTRLLVIYWKDGKKYMFVYDLIARIKRDRQEITGFDQILDAGFMLNQNQLLLLSATKEGKTDIFIYNTQNQKAEQVTNDVYDDLDPVFVSFPNRSAVIIFASNRPSGECSRRRYRVAKQE